MEIVILSKKQYFVRLKKFHGNQFTKAKKQNVVSVQHEVASSSGRKLVGKKYQCNDTNKSINNNENYLCIVNFWNLKNLVSLLKCPECNSTIFYFKEPLRLSHILHPRQNLESTSTPTHLSAMIPDT